MQTRFYDAEESFRAILLVLIENNVKYIKQEAFDKCLFFVKEYIGEKYDIDCTFFGSTKFKEFTVFSRSKCVFFNDNQVAVIRKLREDDIKEGLYHKKMLEAAQCEKCRSVFGISNSKELNEKNFCNKLTSQETILVDDHFKHFNKNDRSNFCL